MTQTILSAIAFSGPSTQSGHDSWPQGIRPLMRVVNVVIGGKTIPILQRRHLAALGDGPIELDDLIAGLEADHGADFLSDARKWAAETVYGNSDTLASLRMKAGLSQAQLASRMNMKQPQLARIERGKNDIQVSMVSRIGQALGLPDAVVFEAARRTIQGGAKADE